MREATRKDVDAFVRAVEDHARSSTKEWVRDIDYEHVRNVLNYRQVRVHMVHGLLVAYEIDSPWYGGPVYLQELVIMRVHPGGTVQDALGFLEAVARSVGCKSVVCGSALAHNDAALVRLYRRAGFQRLPEVGMQKVLT